MFRALFSGHRMPLLGTAVLLVGACAAIGFAASEALAAPGAAPASGELRVLFAPDPSDAPDGPYLNPVVATPDSLSRALGAKATMTPTTSIETALRAARSGEFQVIVAPPHVIAVALRSGYTLVATSGLRRSYALLASSQVGDITQLGTKRIDLPQRDSLQSLLAKSLLLESGMRLEYLPKVRYGGTTRTGLLALELGMTDATVADRDQALRWIAANTSKGHVLKVMRPVPAGLSIAVRDDVCAAECPRMSAWVQSAEGSIPGVGRFKLAGRESAAEFSELAALTEATPTILTAKASPPPSKN